VTEDEIRARRKRAWCEVGCGRACPLHGEAGVAIDLLLAELDAARAEVEDLEYRVVPYCDSCGDDL